MNIFSNIRWANISVDMRERRFPLRCSLIKIRPDPERMETVSELYEMIQGGFLEESVFVESKKYEGKFLERLLKILKEAGHVVYLFDVQKGTYQKVWNTDLGLECCASDMLGSDEPIGRGSIAIQTSQDGWMGMNEWDWWKETDPQSALDPFLLTLLSQGQEAPTC